MPCPCRVAIAELVGVLALPEYSQLSAPAVLYTVAVRSELLSLSERVAVPRAPRSAPVRSRAAACILLRVVLCVLIVKLPFYVLT